MERKQYKFNIKGINKLIIKSIVSDVKIERENISDTVTVDYDQDNVNYVQYSICGDTLTIEQKKRGFIWFAREHNNLLFDINLPKDIALDQLEITVVSGKFELSEWKLDKLKITSVSGDFELKTMQLNSLFIKSVSGDAMLDNIGANNIGFDFISGSPKGKDIACNNFDCKMVSGDIRIKNLEVNVMNINSVSGDVDLVVKGKKEDYCVKVEEFMNSRSENENAPKSIHMKAISGDLKVDFVD